MNETKDIATVVKCSRCGRESEDVKKNPHAWDGWNFWLGGRSCANCVDTAESLQAEQKGTKVPA